MKGRIRKKRKKQAYVEGLERGNRYLLNHMVKQENNYNHNIAILKAERDLTQMLLYAAVIAADGSVTIKTKGLKDILDGMDIKCEADAEGHTVHIEVKDKAEE